MSGNVLGDSIKRHEGPRDLTPTPLAQILETLADPSTQQPDRSRVLPRRRGTGRAPVY